MGYALKWKEYHDKEMGAVVMCVTDVHIGAGGGLDTAQGRAEQLGRVG